ncbi:MAG: STAS domain-containing protein [Phycisphaerae bacterium]|jgi:anti-sigma B factor antagonist
MAERPKRLKVSVDSNGITTVELTDKKILDELNIANIGDQLNALVAESASPKLVLDFSAVGHMSSSALGMLITLNKRLREKNGQLRLCGIRPSIYEVFAMTRLNEILQICPTKEEAIASLG